MTWRDRQLEWLLRIGVAGEFIGHGLLAIEGKKDWIAWISQMLHVSNETSTTLLALIGAADVAVGLSALIRPIGPVLLWAALWGFWTALVRPLVGLPVWDFVERSANWAAPLALFFLYRGRVTNESQLWAFARFTPDAHLSWRKLEGDRVAVPAESRNL